MADGEVRFVAPGREHVVEGEGEHRPIARAKGTAVLVILCRASDDHGMLLLVVDRDRHGRVPYRRVERDERLQRQRNGLWCCRLPSARILAQPYVDYAGGAV